MFSKGYWIHKNSMDVFYEILRLYDVHPDYIKVKYRCWNKGQMGVPFLLPGTYKSKVMKGDRMNWSRYQEGI